MSRITTHEVTDRQLKAAARLIAFYLPQFHPIPENDQWWGKGFTEWTNVAKAKPLYPKHYQPRVPADLGFYDLRVPETRIAQAEMARAHGIEAFCYWHYWFAGKRLLERPFNEVLRSGEPDFPFCLAWANDSWTGIWHGAPNRILVKQTYPGTQDYINHFYAVLEAFQDDRYLTVNDKPLFVVFRPYALPEPRAFTDCWRELAYKEGLPGLYFVGIAWKGWKPGEHGFDAYIEHPPGSFTDSIGDNLIDRATQHLLSHKLGTSFRQLLQFPRVVSYQRYVHHEMHNLIDAAAFPCILPNWDNTPRSGARGLVLHRSTPESFQQILGHAIKQVQQRDREQRIVFIKSWNEWAEGNYLEPDRKFGRKYLDAVKNLIFINAHYHA